MGVPDHLTCLLRNLFASQAETVSTGHGTIDWFQIWKGVHQGCIVSPCLLKLHAEYIMKNARLDEAQAGIKIAGRQQSHCWAYTLRKLELKEIHVSQCSLQHCLQ